MKILMLNQDWFAQELKELGHKVVTAGLSFASHLDVTVDVPLLHVDRLITLCGEGFHPDVIMVHDNSAPIFFTGLDETDIPVCFYSVDTHHHCALHRYLGEIFDFSYVAQRDYLPFFNEWQQEVEWLPLWASRHIEPSDEKKHGAVFVGTLNPRLNPERVRFFDELRAKAEVLCTTGEFWTIFPHSEIVINQTVKGDLNFRVFEAMMSGAMLLTERTENGLTELFTDGEHLMTYQKGNVDEAAQIIETLLKDPKRVREIGRTGREEILRAHTPMIRAQKVEEKLKNLQKKQSKQKFFAMMVNHTCLSRSNKKIDDAARILALASALKATEYGLNLAESMTNEIACHFVIAAHDYDRYSCTKKGYELLMRMHDAYPEEQVLSLAAIRGSLNHGDIETAKRVTDHLGIEDIRTSYDKAETIIRNLLDAA